MSDNSSIVDGSDASVLGSLEGVTAVAGGIGSGKTVLLRRLARSAKNSESPARVVVVSLFDEFGSLCDEFDGSVVPYSDVSGELELSESVTFVRVDESVGPWRQALDAFDEIGGLVRESDERVFVVVDEAQSLTPNREMFLDLIGYTEDNNVDVTLSFNSADRMLQMGYDVFGEDTGVLLSSDDLGGLVDGLSEGDAQYLREEAAHGLKDDQSGAFVIPARDNASGGVRVSFSE